MRRAVSLAAAIGFLAFSPAPTAAHDAVVRICIPAYEGGPCFRPPPYTSYEGEGGPSYRFGDAVVVKGRVGPSHAGRVEILRRKAPEYEVRRLMPDFPFPLWEVVGTVRLDAQGRYRYVWKTTRADADHARPYQLRVRLAEHGESRIHEVYVLYGE